MRCANCGVDNRQGGKFCRECGSPLSRACPSCGTAVIPDAKFCDECGTTLDFATSTPMAEIQPVATATATADGDGGHGHRRSDRRAAPVLGAVRRPRRLHAARRETRPRGDQRAPLPLFRTRPPHHRPLRRDDREIHRRRCHGRVGRPDRERGRRRAGGAGRARGCGVGGRARRRVRCRPCSTGRCRHGGGRDHHRQGGRGHGARRHCQLRLPGAKRSSARRGPRRRVHLEGGFRRDRVQ